ncbi:MAG: type II toxin-antitoxin system Phd/YefM family antitoxin [Sulfurospirillum sp.]|nr:type II toxin-antitoxin system Phd/YefM family antitoxin [Sulfurospirillum sp.]
MQSIQVAQLKSEFSSVLDQIQNLGESFVIEYGKTHKKVAMLVPYQEIKEDRQFGQLKGKIEIADDFDTEDEDMSKLFYDAKVFP